MTDTDETLSVFSKHRAVAARKYKELLRLEYGHPNKTADGLQPPLIHLLAAVADQECFVVLVK